MLTTLALLVRRLHPWRTCAALLVVAAGMHALVGHHTLIIPSLSGSTAQVSTAAATLVATAVIWSSRQEVPWEAWRAVLTGRSVTWLFSGLTAGAALGLALLLELAGVPSLKGWTSAIACGLVAVALIPSRPAAIGTLWVVVILSVPLTPATWEDTPFPWWPVHWYGGAIDTQWVMITLCSTLLFVAATALRERWRAPEAARRAGLS
ncbi:hypothetical protein [Kytococcus sedentarius]|uniref:hypothetical protein n=1 Tax=Kytococcus sedentarius TaxID=1276 RepID=UPI0035BC2449